ncbi:MAG: Metalloendopeptidase glycoprotease family [Candidatus Saccharibacteria bacterium]|nr:Metalloendopeptidase glycoprotease family [Candidatus Saccharibacteria bacterium]
MKILGIESSCDETAVAVVEDGRKLLSNVIQTQIDIHSQYGGVVPEVAARSHIEVINPVINQALRDADCTWDDIDAIAVTYAPGLIGSLLVGTLAARTLALIHNKPLYPIHHVEAHVYANFIIEKMESQPNNLLPSERGKTIIGAGEHGKGGRAIGGLRDLVLPSSQPQFPMLALIVSGGHSQLVLFQDHGNYELLGQTQDDAVGEAFDKVAKIIGLPYPGGPSVAKAALAGDPHKYKLPKAKLTNPYDFSFSGLKTALLRAVQHETGNDYTFPSHDLPALLSDVQRNDFAASFQQTAVETLVDKAEKAFKDYSPASVVIAGGVAANQELRRQLQERLPLNIEYAPMQLCTDNGAMIAALGYFYAQKKDPVSPFDLEVVPSLSMTKTAWA